MALRHGDILTLAHPHRDVTAVAIAMRQTLVATGTQSGKIHLWESSIGEELMVLGEAHEELPVNSLDFSSDGSVLASAGEDGRLVLWDIADIEHKVRFRYLEGHGKGVPILCVAFSRASTLMCTGGKDGDVILWGNLGRPVCGRLRGHRSWVTCCTFSADGAYCATGGFDHAMCLWNTTTFTIVSTLRRHTAPLSKIYIAGEGSVIVSGDDSGTILLSRKDGTVLRKLLGHREAISGLVILESAGVLMSTSHDWSIKVWSLRGSCMLSRKAHHGRVLDFAVSADEDFYVTAADDFTAKIVPFIWDDAGALDPEDVAQVDDRGRTVQDAYD
jgi:WD40 repeat protein